MKSQEFPCEHSDVLSIDLLKPHPNNANTHSDAQIERMAKIIAHQGFRSPIVISSLSGYIVCGHGRALAAQKLGLKFVPVDYQAFPDEASEYQHLIADNALKDWSTLDLAAVNAMMLDLGPDFDPDLMGLQHFSVDPVDKFNEDEKEHEPKGPRKCPHCDGEL